MGNDGGSIPKRRELVKEAARNPTTTEVKATQQEQQAYRWTADPLSGDPLRKPVVSDCRGTLYNKDAVIDFLLPVDAERVGRLSSKAVKAEAEEITKGEIKTLRDVVEVNFESEEAGDKGGISNSRLEGERWKCPVTNERLGPGARAVYLVPCGHAFAESVIKEIADDRCLQCDEIYTKDNIIPILRTSEAEAKRLASRIQTLREKGLTHSLKKAPGAKKRKKDVNVANVTPKAEIMTGDDKKSIQPDASSGLISSVDRDLTMSKTTNKTSSSIRNVATASLTVKVLQEQEERNKRRKIENNTNLEALFLKKAPGQLYPKNTDFMSRGFTIPTKSEK